MADDYGTGQQVTLEAEVVEAAFASHVTVCPLCSFESCNRQAMLKHLKDRHKTTISELKQQRGAGLHTAYQPASPSPQPTIRNTKMPATGPRLRARRSTIAATTLTTTTVISPGNGSPSSSSSYYSTKSFDSNAENNNERRKVTPIRIDKVRGRITRSNTSVIKAKAATTGRQPNKCRIAKQAYSKAQKDTPSTGMVRALRCLNLAGTPVSEPKSARTRKSVTSGLLVEKKVVRRSCRVLAPSKDDNNIMETNKKEVASTTNEVSLKTDDTGQEQRFTPLKKRETRARENPAHLLLQSKLNASAVGKQKTPSSCKRQTTSAKNRMLNLVRASLHASTVPERLPCRDEQFSQIAQFILPTLEGQTSRTMYISGVPGTGKTATVKQVIKHLRETEGRQFEFIEVNGMRLSEPAQVFVEIYRQLNGDAMPTGCGSSGGKISAKTARRRLDRQFQLAQRGRPPVVLLVDELDLLYTRRQDILYDLFNWPTYNESRLVVLAIANTLDLPERMLNHRVSSRMGMSRLCFAPYNHREIGLILCDRLQPCVDGGAVDKDALEFASRKVASVSGDLRKALDIVRRAAEIALDADHTSLALRHVQQAVKELSSTARVQCVRALSDQAKAVLRAAVAEHSRTGHDDLPFKSIYEQYRTICHVDNLGALPSTSAYQLCATMICSRLLVPCPGLGNWTRKLRLGLSPEDAIFALDESKLI